MSKARDTKAGFIKMDAGVRDTGSSPEELEEKAQILLRKIKDEGKSVPLLVVLGRLYYEARKVNEALAAFREARALDAKNNEVLNNLSVIYYEKGLLDAALNTCMDSLKISSHQPAVHNNVGVIYSEQGNWEDAVKHYEKATALQPEDATIHANLGAAYSFLSRTQEAKQEYAKALELDPDHVTAHYCLGMEVKMPGFLEVGRTINVGTLLKVSSQLVYKGRQTPKVFSSRIEDMTENTITVAAPLVHGDVLPFRPGMGVVIGTPGEDALYGFYTKIMEVKRGDIPLLILKRPKAPQRVQRRKYVRVGASVLKSARVLNAHEVHILHTVKHKADRNISAGGVMLTLSKALPTGTVLMLEIILPNGEMKVAGQVVRSTKNEHGDYDVGVRFVGLTDKERARLLHFVHGRQVESRKLGAGDSKAITPIGRVPVAHSETRRGHL